MPEVTVLSASLLEEDHLFLERVLNSSSCQVVGVGTCRDLLEQARRWRAAVVVTDRDLPDGSWRDILHGMQDDAQRPLLIVASRHADGHLWAEVLNLGGYDVLAKPFDALEVQRVVGSACQRWSHRLALEQA